MIDWIDVALITACAAKTRILFRSHFLHHGCLTHGPAIEIQLLTIGLLAVSSTALDYAGGAPSRDAGVFDASRLEHVPARILDPSSLRRQRLLSHGYDAHMCNSVASICLHEALCDRSGQA